MRRETHPVKPKTTRVEVAPVEEEEPQQGVDDEAAEAEGEEEPEGEGNEEVRGVPRLRAPRQPSQAESEEHRSSGCQPPRSWCPFCVGARGVASPHSMSHEVHEQPTVSMDYCYPCSSGAEETERYARAKRRQEEGLEAEDDETAGKLPTLIIRDSASSAMYALAVSAKGAVYDAVVRTVGVLRQLGY